MRKLYFCFIAFSGLIFFPACTVYRAPGINNIPPGDICVLEDNGSFRAGIIVDLIDGRRRGMGFPTRFELLPGSHEITLYGNPGLGVSPDRKSILFVGKAGVVYQIKVQKFEKGDAGIYEYATWKAWIIEKTSVTSENQK
jgi:hypothetical protein